MPNSEVPSSYWGDTRRPLVNLVFIAPLIVLYELGVWWTTTLHGTVRNGADEWVRSLLQHVADSLDWYLPLALLSLFLVWHLLLKQSWTIRTDVLAGMTAESLLYASLLILVGQAADGWLHGARSLSMATMTANAPDISMRLVHFLGAGLYEEFLFRLCLFPATYLVLRGLLIPSGWSVGLAIVVTSVLFALAHYLTPTSDATLLSILTDAVNRVQSRSELWFGFTFRLLAGMMFAALFVWRGFGIAVGCHAAYDIVVGIILVSEL